MNRTLTRASACLALTGAALIGGTATGQAAQPTFPMKSGSYVATLKGVQTVGWESKHVKQFDCDSNSAGKGTEVIRYKSKKPVRLRIFKIGASEPMIMGAKGTKGRPEIDLRSKITRRGELKHWGGKVCSYGDGKGGAPKPPDCGTKRDDGLSVEPQFAYGKKNLITVEQTLFAPLGPFFNCPSGGTSWPSFLDRTKKGVVGKRYSLKKLFGKKKRKHVIEAAGREVVTTPESSSVTTNHWYLTLKRVKGKKRR